MPSANSWQWHPLQFTVLLEGSLVLHSFSFLQCLCFLFVFEPRTELNFLITKKSVHVWKVLKDLSSCMVGGL